jgi:hypothetical protein
LPRLAAPSHPPTTDSPRPSLLVVGARPRLLKLDALLLGLALRVVPVLALLGQNLLRLRLHQLFGQADVADEHVDDINVVLQQVRAHSRLGPLLLLVPVLQVCHRRRLARLVAEDRVNQRVHDVPNQPVNRADLGDHERRVFGLHAEDDAHLKLHRKAILRDHLERVERAFDLLRRPLDRLVRRRDDHRRRGGGATMLRREAPLRHAGRDVSGTFPGVREYFLCPRGAVFDSTFKEWQP